MAPDSVDCTVGILGTGPAACACACVLAQSGIKVALIGPAPEHRLKAGESLPAASIRLLRRLGLDDLSVLLSHDEYLPCSANASSWGEDSWAYRDAVFNPEGSGWHVLRHRFDAAMLDHAKRQGCMHVQALAREKLSDSDQETVHRIRAERPDGSSVHISAQWLVDATGRQAWLTRRMGPQALRWAEQYAAVGWIRSGAEDVDNTTRVKSVKNGWWYTARLPQGWRVIAFHGLRECVGALAKDLPSMEHACKQSGVLPETFQTQISLNAIQIYDASMRSFNVVYGKRWLAVGDAALAFDPLSSQGIFFALYSGIRGAEAVAATLHEHADATSPLMDAYKNSVVSVREANRKALAGFAASERRFTDAPYWRLRQASTGRTTVNEFDELRP